MQTPPLNKTLRVIRERWSPRSIVGPTPPAETLKIVFEAARWAPSAFNEQPWRFIITTQADGERFQRALECLAPGNRVWVQSAPVLIFCVTKDFFEFNGKDNVLAPLDLGLSVQNLMLEATRQGLVSHPMSGILPDCVRTTFAVPENYTPTLAIALGYLGEANRLEGDLYKMETAERTRLPLGSFVFDRTWGKELP